MPLIYKIDEEKKGEEPPSTPKQWHCNGNSLLQILKRFSDIIYNLNSLYKLYIVEMTKTMLARTYKSV